VIEFACDRSHLTIHELADRADDRLLFGTQPHAFTSLIATIGDVPVPYDAGHSIGMVNRPEEASA
jgi:hypothetical protein